MKITQYRNNEKVQTQRTMSMEAALNAMQTEIKSKPVTTMRSLLQHAMPGAKYDCVRKVPLMVFGGTFRKVGSEQQMVSYNGLVMLEVNNLSNLQEAKELQDRVITLPQTFLCFVGSSGKSVKILIPFTLMDGTLPQSTENIRLFHAQAYREAVKWYQPQIDRNIDLRKPTVDMAVRLTYDPTLYYNPTAVAIRIEQPLYMPEEPTYRESRRQISNPLERLLPGYERHYIIDNLFETCLRDAIDKIDGIKTNDDLHPFFTQLAENCFRSGIPEEDGIRYTLRKWELRNYELLTRNIFRNTYMLGQKFGGKPCITLPMTLVAQLEEFMKRRYELRRNTIKGIVEYHERSSFCFDFQPLNKEAINSITMNVLAEGIPAWDADVKRFLESNRVRSYHPIEEYLLSLPKWDGKDRIRQLAGRIECKNPRWADLFYTWFLSMVAHWKQKDNRHANSALPLLVGDQGCGKSTFCLNILPKELRDYYTDSIDFSNRRDVELALNRFALINMDEFDSISSSYQGFVKHIIQKAVIQTRRPYGSATEQLRRHATFIATSNDFDLLTDPTGSRRFICIEVIGVIDYQQPIDYQQLYAQALHAIQYNERYWFTHEEEAYITASNQQFQHTIPEEEIIHLFFRKPTTHEAYEELTCAEILNRVTKRERNFKCTRTMALWVGKALKNKFESRRAHRGWVYKVVEK
jgi:predicted P-loop ATPase